MTKQNYFYASAMVFTIVAGVQLLRALMGWPIWIGAFSLPVWFSWLAFIGAGTLAYNGWRLGNKS